MQVRDAMSLYTTEHLVVPENEFRRTIDELLAANDYAHEGYASAEAQRDLSVRFAWGHDHDFGSFQLAGRMGQRHISMIERFQRYGLPRDLTGCRVLDVGCWTGGTSLVLAALGAEVVAIEEVRKYADCASYLAAAFGVAIEVRHQSLYDLPEREAFDAVLLAGVVYHLSDPIRGLRVTFDALRDGGSCFVESARSYFLPLQYRGPSRPGWNWFFPSIRTLERMMRDVGFDEVRLGSWTRRGRRIIGSAKRTTARPMLLAGVPRSG